MIPRNMIARLRRLEKKAARLKTARERIGRRGPIYTGAQVKVVNAYTSYLVGEFPRYPWAIGFGLFGLPSHHGQMFWGAAFDEFEEWLSRAYPDRVFSKRDLLAFAPVVQDMAEIIFDEVFNSGVPVASRRYFFHPEKWAVATLQDENAEAGSAKRVRGFRLIRKPAGKLLRDAGALARAWSQLPDRWRRIDVHESARTRTPLEYVILMNGPYQ